MTALAPVVDELELFAAFCGDLRVESGARMTLEPFQRTILADFFAGTTETLCLVSKKNGKSTLLASVALYVLCSQPDAEVVIAAASREQASILLRQARGFVRRSEALRERLVVKEREIVHSQLGGRVKVVASGVDRVDGWLGDLALVDELHRHKSAELYGVLRDGLGPRNGRLITISTAGDDELSPLGRLRTRAYGLPQYRRDGAYRYARSADGQFVLHEWSLDTDASADDLALVKTANPASWQTIEKLRERRDSPSTTEWQFRRFAAGQWVRGENSAIDPADWDACATPAAVIPINSSVMIGWDHAWRGPDTAALVPVWWASEDRRVVGDPIVLEAPEGGMVDDRDVFAAMSTFQARYRITAVVFDPSAGAAGLSQQIQRQLGLELVEHSQRDTQMSLADGRLLEAIRRRQIQHTGNEVLRAHCLNAVEVSVQGDRFRFSRPRHGPRRPIDCLTALSMAHSSAVAEAERPPKPSNDWFMY